ncbi:MAG TPA: FG-GAP-like repeat-containing protein, partial [Pyrinomonadaceae bacterium]|nr:FG-GAP-like repeat-containing protein [Pyrinomonadaceae bacterium]
SVAISGETVIVGANSANIGSNVDEGAAYIFDIGNTAFDFDGDGKTDIGLFRPTNGQWWINRSGDNSTFATTFGVNSDRIMPADYDGDGKTDIAFFRPSTGSWFLLVPVRNFNRHSDRWRF